MAKSIRSKWRRKCRAVKRERYGQKELERLKKTLGIDDTKSKDYDINAISEVANLSNIKAIKEKKQTITESEMETDDVPDSEFNKKTLRNKNGAYPVWVHPRKIQKKSKKVKKGKGGKKSKK